MCILYFGHFSTHTHTHFIADASDGHTLDSIFKLPACGSSAYMLTIIATSTRETITEERKNERKSVKEMERKEKKST